MFFFSFFFQFINCSSLEDEWRFDLGAELEAGGEAEDNGGDSSNNNQP